MRGTAAAVVTALRSPLWLGPGHRQVRGERASMPSRRRSRLLISSSFYLHNSRLLVCASAWDACSCLIRRGWLVTVLSPTRANIFSRPTSGIETVNPFLSSPSHLRSRSSFGHQIDVVACTVRARSRLHFARPQTFSSANKSPSLVPSTIASASFCLFFVHRLHPRVWLHGQQLRQYRVSDDYRRPFTPRHGLDYRRWCRPRGPRG